MNYGYGLFPDPWLWWTLAVFVPVLAAAVRRAPWSRLSQPEWLHPYLGGCVALLLFWQLRTTAVAGIEYHFLGVSLLTLMFGAPLAILATTLITAGLVLNGGSDWQTLPLNVLVMGAVPSLLTLGLLRLVERKLPNHFFIYIFINAFFGAALIISVTLLLSIGLLVLGSDYSWAYLRERFVPFIPLMAFPEAFVTGALLTLFVAFRPQWVATFDDRRYLAGK